ncbi:hypothetical protein B0J12DRAFT_649195 [Macrophomina phaseolina]|uniref:Uncharacterized protein n=1 Tax=Macrophomina phaseolina TaxID=35725 RepID=A0ABQ8GLI8_9PEZI|nr:hypothetical protein B0J12DRAFT_649195 [Macrophomina phaseolina]
MQVATNGICTFSANARQADSSHVSYSDYYHRAAARARKLRWLQRHIPPPQLGRRRLWAQATAPTDPDNAVEASRLADASVSDDGYGWVVGSAATVLSWWFIGTVVLLGRSPERSGGPRRFLGLDPRLRRLIDRRVQRLLRCCRLLGSRSTALLGSSLLGLGYVFAGFCTHSVAGLFITASLIMDVGIR